MVCPCGTSMDPADLSARPSPGDLSICSNCYRPFRVDRELKLQVLSPQEVESLELPERRVMVDLILRAVQAKVERADALAGDVASLYRSLVRGR